MLTTSTSKPMRSYRREPTTSQLSLLASVQKIVFGRRRKKNTTTLDLLSSAGFEPQWLRVRWTGGAGSYVMMRGGVMRILVTATKSGFASSKIVPWEFVDSCFGWKTKPAIRRGFRYGWCIELR